MQECCSTDIFSEEAAALITAQNEKLSALLSYVQEDGRICPLPMYWNQLWEMLPDKKSVGSGFSPPVPLILGAWHFASHLEKMLCLRGHIEYAAEKGALDRVNRYLRNLKHNQWYYGR
jgi:hypothetical protein